MVEGIAALLLFAAGSTAGAAAPPAYVDPGAGSLIIQAVAAGLVGGALMIRRIREGIADSFRAGADRISSLFRRQDRPS